MASEMTIGGGYAWWGGVTRWAMRIAKEGTLPFDFASDPVAHDTWFRAKVREALDDPRAAVSHEDVEAHFAARRAAGGPAQR